MARGRHFGRYNLARHFFLHPYPLTIGLDGGVDVDIAPLGRVDPCTSRASRVT
jgi:hypothetical protein